MVSFFCADEVKKLVFLDSKHLGLLNTRHFCTQYFDKKIFFSSQYCIGISKYLELSQKIYFKYTQEKNIG